jgi:hypothetical protein
LRRRFAHLNLSAHFLDLRGLLFKLRRENFHSLTLLRDRRVKFRNGCLLSLDFIVLLQELVEQPPSTDSAMQGPSQRPMESHNPLIESG